MGVVRRESVGVVWRGSVGVVKRLSFVFVCEGVRTPGSGFGQDIPDVPMIMVD